jgi:hypothetical protein
MGAGIVQTELGAAERYDPLPARPKKVSHARACIARTENDEHRIYY